jgi:MFS family permease
VPSQAFARLWFGGAVSGIGAQVSIVAVGLQIYDITESTFMVGLVGGVALLPMIAAGLWGGMLADVFDRRRILVVSSLVGWISTLALLSLSLWDAALISDGVRVQAWPFLVVTTVTAVASTISSATRASVVGRILPSDMISRAPSPSLASLCWPSAWWLRWLG